MGDGNSLRGILIGIIMCLGLFAFTYFVWWLGHGTPERAMKTNIIQTCDRITREHGGSYADCVNSSWRAVKPSAR